MAFAKPARLGQGPGSRPGRSQDRRLGSRLVALLAGLMLVLALVAGPAAAIASARPAADASDCSCCPAVCNGADANRHADLACSPAGACVAASWQAARATTLPLRSAPVAVRFATRTDAPTPGRDATPDPPPPRRYV